MATRKADESLSGDAAIFHYEWLRWMMLYLEMQVEQIDRQLIELEKHLPEQYSFPGDPPNVD